MNIFEASIRNGTIRDETGLKRLFWRLAKKLHPDVSRVGQNEMKFVRLKHDFDDARVMLAMRDVPRETGVFGERKNGSCDQARAGSGERKAEAGGFPQEGVGGHEFDAGHVDPGSGRPDFERCAALFSELVASNFPVDPVVKGRNKRYVERIAALNREIGRFCDRYRDLFLGVEEELYRIRGKSVVSNHPFNLVRLYFYNVSDYMTTRNYFAKLYIDRSRQTVIDVLAEKEAKQTIVFIDWIMRNMS